MRHPGGLRIARTLLIQINRMGLAAATETLDPITPQYIADLIAWSAIGARTTESQTHREMASGLSMPVGFKNSTEGNLQVAINAIQSARQPHAFLGITQDGMNGIVRTTGNPDTHIVLRGGKKPNFDAASIAECVQMLSKAGLEPRVMVDCSHAQTNKDYTRQPEVFARAHRAGPRRQQCDPRRDAGEQPRGGQPGAGRKSRRAEVRRLDHRPLHRLGDHRALPDRRGRCARLAHVSFSEI